MSLYSELELNLRGRKKANVKFHRPVFLIRLFGVMAFATLIGSVRSKKDFTAE